MIGTTRRCFPKVRLVNNWIMKSTYQMSLGDWDAASAPEPSVTQLDPRVCAALLDEHPDYRVLRRMEPRLIWPMPAAASTAKVVILDTETTGLDAATCDIIELAMLSVLVDRETGMPVGSVSEFDSFEEPRAPISKEVTALTGITDEMVRGKRIDNEMVAQFLDQADLIVAHNASFDRPFVEARLPVFSHQAWNCSLAGIDWKKTEKMGAAGLEFLACFKGKFFYEAHRALTDCHALLNVLTEPLSDGRTGLKTLMDGAKLKRYRLSAIGSPFETKDKLKARGYRWDGEKKSWWRGLSSKEELDIEYGWLKTEVYGTRPARLELEEQDSTVQFSWREGVRTYPVL